jgi:CHAD domain-containing protein
MRSPGATFDLRAALTAEIRGALEEVSGELVRPKAVHRCRVHLKRARALARIGRACAPGLAAVFNESARSIMRSLAQARDLAALAACARDIAKDSRGKARDALIATAETLDAARAALPPLNLEAVRVGLRDLLALAQVWPEASPRQIHRGALRIARRARRACRRGHGKSDSARRHEWRKREKDRLYAVLLLDGSWPDSRKRRRKSGERLGEALGRERDALLLIERMETSEPALDGAPVERALRVLHRRRERLGRRADRLGAALHRDGA